jgi:hypothetical protein
VNRASRPRVRRGVYDAVVADFIESGEAITRVSLTHGPLAGMNHSRGVANVCSGLERAVKRISDTLWKPVLVTGRWPSEDDEEYHVLLINRTLLAPASSGQAEDDSELTIPDVDVPLDDPRW